jgi:hypothetical protein
MITSRSVWLAAIWIAVLIHLDWHLGRPAHGHLSFGLPYHWILAIVTLGPLPWLLIRRWPTALLQASVVVLGLGVALGQVLEPLGEVMLYRVGAEPLTNPVRWRVFAEFMAAGILVYIASAVRARKRTKPAAP